MWGIESHYTLTWSGYWGNVLGLNEMGYGYKDLQSHVIRSPGVKTPDRRKDAPSGETAGACG